MQRAPTVGLKSTSNGLEMRGEIEERLSAHEEAAGNPMLPGECKRTTENCTIGTLAVVMISVAPMWLNPTAHPMPSRGVDLPEPFSPTRNVTGVSKVTSKPGWNRDMPKGWVPRATRSSRSEMRVRNGLGL